MKTTKKIIIATSMVLACATAAVAQEPQRSVYELEKLVTAGTATREQQLQLARAYNEAGRYYEASKIAKRFLDRDAADADAAAVRDASARGMQTIAQQRLDAARANATRSGATDEDRLALADAYYQAGDYRGAADAYGKLPESARSRENRVRHARSLAWTSNYDRAERAYSALLKEDSTPELELEYGRLLSWMGAAPASVEALRRVYLAKPTEASAIAYANARAWNADRDGAIVLLTEYTTADPNAAEARQLMIELQGSPDLRLERTERLIAQEPFNLALHVERARLLHDAGRFATALKEIAFIRKHATQPIDGLDELEREAKTRRDETIARLDEQRRALGSISMTSSAGDNSDNTKQIIDLAKAYTGQGAYDQAIDLYEDYLRVRPDDTTARINYARVLSWDSRYDSAQKQYEILLREMPDRADLRYEYAQALSYNAEYVPAMRNLRDLTDVSDNPRANLYPDVPAKAYHNIGQIYRWYGWNDTAIEQQNRALALNSDFAPARTELTLARYQRPASTYRATYGFAEDSNDFQFRRIDVDGQRWLNQRTAIEGSIGRHEFDRRGDDVFATVGSVGGRYRWQDQWTARARVGANFYDRGLGTRPFWGLGVDWLPSLQVRTAADYNHYDLVYDAFSIQSLGPESAVPTSGRPLDIDDFRGRIDYRSGGFWSFLGDASYGLVSDDNKRQAAHALLSFRVFRSPFIAIKADGRWLSYDFRSNRYWSPSDYHSLAGVLQIGQDFRSRFFWTVEAKVGKAYERDRTSDLRAYAASITVPVNDTFDVIGSYNYGKSGRFDNLIGGSGEDFTNYWQRSFYVGVRLKRLFSSDDIRPEDRYYYDNRVFTGSPVVAPVGEIR